MNLEQYAAQTAQDAQQQPETQEQQEPLTNDQLRAKLDADKLYSLMALAQEDIDSRVLPESILQDLVYAMFGESSPQAKDVDALTGGYEMAISCLMQRRKLLKKQVEQLKDQLKSTDAEIQRIDQEIGRLKIQGTRAEELDEALIDVLAIYNSLDSPQVDLLTKIESLYSKYNWNRAAMGLLYGCLADARTKLYFSGALTLDQLAHVDELKNQLEASICK